MGILPIGIYDDPKNQVQAIVGLDLLKTNIVIFGSSMSGKTTFVKSLLVRMHEKLTPQDENVYIIDFSGALLNFRNLGFVCACFDNSNEENIKRLFNKLENILIANTRTLKGTNFPEYNKADKPAHTTLIIENFNGFLADKRYEPYQENLMKICREGLSKGITVVLTNTDIKGGVTQYIGNFGQKICFELSADKLVEIFGTKVMTPMSLPGRGLANINNQIYEFQCFIPFKDEEKELEEYTEKIRQKFASFKIPRINSFDGELNTTNFAEYSHENETLDAVNLAAQANGTVNNPVTFGLDYYDMKPVTLDFGKSSSIAIFGKRQSGKTNLLWLLVKEAVKLKNENGLRFVLFDDGRKQLVAFRDFLASKGVGCEFFTSLIDLEGYFDGEGAAYLEEYRHSELPFTVFLIQSKTIFTSKIAHLLRDDFPQMLSDPEGKFLFIYPDVKNISDIEMKNAFNDSLSVAFLLDNIGEFAADRGSKTIFGAMDPKELKEKYARIETGDGYFYDIDSDELVKLKFIYSDELKQIENKEASQ